MNKQTILSLILFTFFISANAQLKVLDKYNNSPISNVKMFSKEGRIIAISNLKGKIITEKIDFPKNDSIEIYHSNYVSKKMIWNAINNTPKIILTPDSITKLEEVVLTVKKPEYLLLKGYYISYQIIDDIALSFSDGIIEYYINLDKNKIIGSKIIESRTFKNHGAIKALEKRKGKSTLNVLSTIPPFSFREEVLLNEWKKYKTDSEGNILKKKNKIGRITNNNEISEFTIEYYSPQNTKKTSILGITSLIKNKTISEKFNSRTPEINKLISLGKYYNSEITIKDVTINYELIQDFYSTENKYLSNEKFKKYREKEKTKPIILYLGNNTKSVIPEVIELMLYKELELIPNEG